MEREIKSWRREKKVSAHRGHQPRLGRTSHSTGFPDQTDKFPRFARDDSSGLISALYFPAVKPIPPSSLALLSSQLRGRRAAAAPALRPRPPGELAPPVPTEALVGPAVSPSCRSRSSPPTPALQSDTLYAPYRDRADDAHSGPTRSSARRSPAARPRCAGSFRRSCGRPRGARPGSSAIPTQMGQAMLRSPKMKDIPDPLRSSLRNLMAVAGGRVVMVPAALAFSRSRTGGFAPISRSWWRTPARAR